MMKNPIIPFYKQIDKTIVKAKDCYIYDSHNKRYIDFEAGDWAAFLGHSNKKINKVLKKQMDILIHDGLRFKNNESEELSKLLLDKLLMNGGKCTFLNSGSEAVNCALTLARHLTRRSKILKIDCTYLSAYGFGRSTSDNTDLINIQFDNMRVISDLDFCQIAAFAFEPGTSCSMIKYPANEFVKSIAQAVKQNGGLLIANEVTTGIGRTGKWFGFQHYDFCPDIVAVGKSIGNGYPVSGVAISSKVAAMFDESPFRYAQSHQNDPLGCAIGVEVIKQIEQNRLIHRSYEIGNYLREKLYKLQTKHSSVIKEIRARGLMIGVELDNAKNAESIYMNLIDKGILIGCKENVLRFMPPAVIQKKHIDFLIETINGLLGLV